MVTLVTSLYGSIMFIIENWSVNFNAVLPAIKIASALIQSIGSFINIGLNMSKIKALHLALQQSVDECMYYTSSFIMLIKRLIKGLLRHFFVFINFLKHVFS